MEPDFRCWVMEQYTPSVQISKSMWLQYYTNIFIRSSGVNCPTRGSKVMFSFVVVAIPCSLRYFLVRLWIMCLSLSENIEFLIQDKQN